ncbi:MAG: FG-GAP-like repeat-containing protein, partial [candidate division NC10 bacterium]|nr:FG-GAP-like repeat-containing protein [candidate division NC10 bacterium]
PTGALTVSGNAASTNSTAATLNLSATDAVGVVGYYRATSSTPPSPTAAGWVAVTSTTSFSANVAYTLSSGDGTKTVYAWYKDAAGNVSTTASDSILLDQSLPGNGTLTATAGNGQVALTWSGFSDGGSGLSGTNPYRLVFATGGVPAASCTSGTQLLLGSATSFTHTGLTNGTTYSYRVCASDNAGNVSTGATASATPQAPDTTPPTAAISTPTASATYSTGSSPLSLGGTAADSVGVTQVTWASDRGGSGTASGTTSWTVSGIVLQAGTNVLTVTARDAAGNTGTDTLTVTYAPADSTPPAAVTDLNASNASNVSLDLTWTAPGDDGGTGQAGSYDVRYSTSTITLANWGSATPVPGVPAPAPRPAGSGESFTVGGLIPKTTYYFALRTLDEVPNFSPLSNVVRVMTKKQPPPARNFQGKLGSVILTWELPAVPQEVPFPVQVVIRRTVAAPAVSPTDGVFIYEGSGTSAVDCTVTPQTYFYTAFVYEAGDPANISTPSALSIAVPSAAGPASLTVRTLPGTRTFLGGNYGYLGTFGGIVSQSGELRVAGLPAGKYVLRTRLAGFVDGYRLVQLCSGENVVPLDLVPFDPAALLDPTARALEAGGAAIRGTGASAPFVVDWDADGKKDLVVAGGDGAIVLYRNAGSEAAPQFSASEPIVADGAPIAVIGPAFGFVVDWDGDGRKDLVVGDGQGAVRWYRNTLEDATPQLRAWGFLDAGGGALQVVGPAAPVVVDWNADGTKDLLVGAGDGTVSVFLNQGTDANPVLAAGVTLSLPEVGVSRAYARPFVADWNQDGRQDLLVGDANGRTYVFLNAGTDGAPAFPTGVPLTGRGAPVAVSSRAAPFVVDWDSNGSRDLVIGSNDGEVFLIQ